MSTPTGQAGRVKTYVLDGSVLLYAPHAIFAFDDNIVVIPECVVNELHNISINGSGALRASAREFGVLLDTLLRETGGSFRDGIPLYAGGILRISDTSSPDARAKIIKGPLDAILAGSTLCADPILVTRSAFQRVQASLYGVKAEEFKSEAVTSGRGAYEGRCILYVTNAEMNEFATTGKLSLDENRAYCATSMNGDVLSEDYKLSYWEHVILTDMENSSHGTMLGVFNGKVISRLYNYAGSKDPLVYGVSARNVGQVFALDALLAPPEEVPLVILRGPAGTGKTFLAVAAALAQTLEHTGTTSYRKILITRPNTKMDEDIGYLKGTETDKVLPALRGLLDNVDNLMPNHVSQWTKDEDRNQMTALESLMSQGIIIPQALAYMRGRSINNQIILVDEVQNATPNQVLSIVTRVGAGTKIVLMGDVDQIDHPFLDKRSNGLAYAAEHMRGSKTCRQITFVEDECERSALASEAIARLTPKGVM